VEYFVQKIHRRLVIVTSSQSATHERERAGGIEARPQMDSGRSVEQEAHCGLLGANGRHARLFLRRFEEVGEV
jgi:hypothetical protein